MIKVYVAYTTFVNPDKYFYYRHDKYAEYRVYNSYDYRHDSFVTQFSIFVTHSSHLPAVV